MTSSRIFVAREGAGRALGNPGTNYMDLGVYPKAITRLEEALHIFQDIDNRQAECWILTARGLMHHQMEHDEQAVINR